MEITDVQIKLMDHDRMRAVASIILDDCFVVRDMKIIEGPQGLFVAMPSRKVMAHCPRCQTKNPLQANFCYSCGRRLVPQPADRVHADIAHPITVDCRQQIERVVLAAYRREQSAATGNADTAN